MVQIESFGKMTDGTQARRYTLENKSGMKAVLTDLGANLIELWAPDRNGTLRDVVWGYADALSYEHNPTGFGSTIGRNANRIGGAEVTIDEVPYPLEKNNNQVNNLHSGVRGYNKRMWQAKAGEESVVFTLLSPDGDQGFPGNAEVSVTYTLTDANELKIHYRATADRDTIFNLTNHSYFNLEGEESDSILEQSVWIDADAMTPVADSFAIPTGEIRDIRGTAMDFTKPKPIGRDIDADYDQLQFGGGYDHNYVLNHPGAFRVVASMYAERTGIFMQVSTDLPGMQFYTANFLDGEVGGKRGRVYGRRSAACFETQYYPDANHHANFPSTIVRAGEVYETETAYSFSVK